MSHQDLSQSELPYKTFLSFNQQGVLFCPAGAKDIFITFMLQTFCTSGAFAFKYISINVV
jgi:hypothetical protein